MPVSHVTPLPVEPSEVVVTSVAGLLLELSRALQDLQQGDGRDDENGADRDQRGQGEAGCASAATLEDVRALRPSGPRTTMIVALILESCLDWAQSTESTQVGSRTGPGEEDTWPPKRFRSKSACSHSPAAGRVQRSEFYLLPSWPSLLRARAGVVLDCSTLKFWWRYVLSVNRTFLQMEALEIVEERVLRACLSHSWQARRIQRSRSWCLGDGEESLAVTVETPQALGMQIGKDSNEQK